MRSNQIKAGRAWLGWTQADLAENAGVHPKTVAYWEARDCWGVPPDAIEAMFQAFKRHGVYVDHRGVAA